MNWHTRPRKMMFATLVVIGIGAIGIYAPGSARRWRAPAKADTHKGELVGVVSTAAPPQEAAKPTPAPAVSVGVWMYQMTEKGLAAEITAKSTNYYKTTI